MDLYIANTTEQDHYFMWQEVESHRVFNVTIPPGQQILIMRDSLEHEVMHVVNHHRAYGMMTYDEAKAAKAKEKEVRLVYSTGKPLPIEVYAIAQEVNDDFRAHQTQLAKEKTALGFAKSVESNQDIREGVASVEISIEEEKPKELDRQSKPRVKQSFSVGLKK